MKKNSILAAIACTAVLALATVSTVTAQPLVNGSFESPSGTGLAPASWTLNLSGGTGVTSTTYAQSGVQSLMIDSTGAGAWSSPNVFQSFAASAGMEFYFSGYMLRSAPITDASFGLLKMEFKNSGGTILTPASASIGAINFSFPGVESTPFLTTGTVPANTWLFTQLQGVAPTGTASVQFYLLNVNQGVAPGPMYFDNITALAVPEPATLALVGLGLAGLVAVRRRK